MLKICPLGMASPEEEPAFSGCQGCNPAELGSDLSPEMLPLEVYFSGVTESASHIFLGPSGQLASVCAAPAE